MSIPAAASPLWPGEAGDRVESVELLERGTLLEQLDALLGEAALGRGRLVLVTGEAGIGKSTFVDEFTSGRSSRVLWGICDPMVPPRPLAPIFDIADQVGGILQSALATADRHRILSAFLGLLRAEGGPWLAVLEDMQWADEATLEVLKVVGRRAAQLRAIVIATYRDDEVGPDHPLSIALGDIPAASTVSIRLPPLSVAAVEVLASGTPIDPEVLHRATSGNPFFVTELLAAGGPALPTTVRDAVCARVRRLSPPAVQVIQAASVLGPRCDPEILCAVADAGPAAVDECVARGILRSDRSTIDFRHELSRQAVLESLASSERSRLHTQALASLRHHTPPVESRELARHAVEAGDADAVVELAPRAAAEAASLGAHAAARSHLESALRYVTRLPEADRASLMAAHAHELYLADDIEGAVTSEEQALSYWRQAGDPRAAGRSLTSLCVYLWWSGEPERSQRAGTEAIELLESLPPDEHLADAYARFAGRLMVGGEFAAAANLARKAVALGEQLGEEAVVVHALNSLGVSEINFGVDDGWAALEESLRRAQAAELEEDTARAFNNLIATSRENRRYDLFDSYSRQAATFFDDHDLDAMERCLMGDVVEALFERGMWREASVQAHAVVDWGTTRGRMQCLAILGRLAARRGQPEAFRWLDEALEMRDRFGGEVMCPLRAARAEAAWLAGDARGAAREVEAGFSAFTDRSNPWALGELAIWSHKVGFVWALPKRPAEPYAFYLEGHPEKAASAWADLGCPYEEAQALAECEDEAAVRRALSIFQSLGAAPAAAAVADGLRARGAHRIGRGPRRTTRANPSGLSDREVEVLALLADGLRNAEIAGRLVVSTRTVDHHVSAILAKLDVRSRYEAGQKAAELGLK
jgi:predicted ATPase/DNA-binding CsgD family transcriptional regulator